MMDICIATILVAALAAGAASISVPGLLGRPMMPSLLGPLQLASPQELTQTPIKVPTEAAKEPFALTVSGNVYFDKMPVQGAEVSIYHNGRYRGKTTAGDLYSFKVPGVMIGDTIRVEARYQGYTGTATEVVKFKNMYLDVNIKSDRSFIRTALEMLPTEDELKKAQEQRQQSQQPATSQTTPQGVGGSGITTTPSDAQQLTSQIMSDTFGNMGKAFSKSGGTSSQSMVPTTVSDAIPGDMKVTKLEDALKFA